MKTLPEIDAILRDAGNKARIAREAGTLDAARQHAAGAGTLIRKARAALAEVAAAAKPGDVAKPGGDVAKPGDDVAKPDGGRRVERAFRRRRASAWRGGAGGGTRVAAVDAA